MNAYVRYPHPPYSQSKSEKAMEMSIYVVRAFVQMRKELTISQEVLKRLAQIDKKLLEHDNVIEDLVHNLIPLLFTIFVHQLNTCRRKPWITVRSPQSVPCIELALGGYFRPFSPCQATVKLRTNSAEPRMAPSVK